jgi:nucleoid DNA-binding protein
VKKFREEVARELNELLDFKFKDIRASKGYQLVGIVTKVMTQALLRGESVRVIGFGTFSLKTRGS